MPDYRRAYLPGGTFFFTIVTGERHPLFTTDQNVELLRSAVADVRAERSFEILAAVVLPDHLHFIWTLPDGDSDYSWRIGRMKALFTKSLRVAGGAHPAGSIVSRSKERHRESNVWQRRFWEHVIRDEGDLENHLNYVHYNPVKHGVVNCPHGWRHSSFSRWVNEGGYSADWCCGCRGGKVRLPYPQELDRTVGE